MLMPCTIVGSHIDLVYYYYEEEAIDMVVMMMIMW